MAHITVRRSATWSERLLYRLDVVLERLEQVLRGASVDKCGDFHDAVHVTQIRRLAAHGCNGQALI